MISDMWSTHGINEQVARALTELEHLRIDMSRLEVQSEYAAMVGGFGTITVARLEDELVAVKELRLTGALQDRARFACRFARELKVWALLDHPNLLKLKGFCLSRDIQYARFICSFYPHGHIGDYLEKNQPDANTRGRLAMDTAQGLQHLHHLRIVHGDLKDGNVLVDNEVRAMLCDYGLAKIIDDDGVPSGMTTSKDPISVRFASPERMNDSLRDFAGDVWSWACLFVKIVTGVNPYKDATSDVACVLRIARGDPPADVSDLGLSPTAQSMLLECWRQDPSARPSIKDCIEWGKGTRKPAGVIMEEDPVRDPQRQSDPSSESHSKLPSFEGGGNRYVRPLRKRRRDLGDMQVDEQNVHSSQRDPDGDRNANRRRQASKKGRDAPKALATPTAVVPTADGGIGELTMSALAYLDAEQVPANLKKEGSDWFAIFNPQAPRKLDITLSLSLTHESVVCCVKFSKDGKFLATGCNRSAQVYDIKTRAKICTLIDDKVIQDGDLWIRSVCFSPDGRLLATGAEDRQIRIWDIASRSIRQVFQGHQQEIYSLDFSRDGSFIVSGSGDKTARVWNMQTGAHKKFAIIEPESVDVGVTSVTISDSGRLVATGSLDNIVRIWRVQTGRLVERLRGHTDMVYSVAFTPDGMGLISGSLDNTLKYWDLSPVVRSTSLLGLVQGGVVPSGQQPVEKEGGESGSTCCQTFVGHKDYVLSVTTSPDGNWVVSGSKDRGVQFWDPKTGQAQLRVIGHANSVISIDVSPSGGLVASGSGDRVARVWSYTSV